MVYHGTYSKEIIAVRPMDWLNETHFIELVRSADEPTFWVTCCCDEDWFYEFYLESNSDYERVKFNIMEQIFKCDTMDELLGTLSEIFEDGFESILVEHECDATCDCENSCNHCNCK